MNTNSSFVGNRWWLVFIFSLSHRRASFFFFFFCSFWILQNQEEKNIAVLTPLFVEVHGAIVMLTIFFHNKTSIYGLTKSVKPIALQLGEVNPIQVGLGFQVGYMISFLKKDKHQGPINLIDG
jgi:hypothetical protein